MTLDTPVARGRTLAAFGGRPAVPRHLRSLPWPVITDEDRAAVLSTLDGEPLVSNVDGESPVTRLEREWARRCGTRWCVGTSNGTTALTTALAALGVGPGDEVIVPALSFIASGLAPLHQMAVPVFADIDPVTFNLDPDVVRALIGPRTAAILPVHLHGHPAPMDPLLDLAGRHGLAVLEDAAQAHGAVYRGRRVGSLGHAGAFSLQVTKNLPTCGEGGLLVTDDEDLARKARMTRQFGEVIEPGRDRDYISYQLGWNHKLSSVQAAFTLSQLDRFDDYEAARQANVARLLARLAQLPGLVVPTVAEDCTHAWHILRLRFDPERAGLPGIAAGDLRRALHRLLRAEGVPVSRYQLMPLPDQRVFTDRIGFGGGQPWAALEQQARPTAASVPATVRTAATGSAVASAAGAGAGAGAGGGAATGGGSTTAADCPVARQVVDDSLTLQKRHLNPGAGPALEHYADGFEKVWENLATVARMAAG